MKKWLLFFVAFAYYTVLAAKDFTWIFVSGDSGDWLASATMWFVPQGFGSPLYISLAKVVGAMPFDLPAAMAVILSSLPAAVTVLLVYLIVKKLGTERGAVAASIILLGSAVFLTQATVVEEYSLSAMFLTLAFYLYLNNKRQLMALSLGMATAVHVLVLPLAVLWFALHLKEWRTWIKVIPVYIVSGILPYTLILWLMASDAPRLFAGGLSLAAVNEYLGGTYVVGSLSIWATPERLFALVGILLASFGLALIPAFKGWIKGTPHKMMLIVITFPVWYYLTCLHPSTWTYITWACPFIAVMAGQGIEKLTIQSYRFVLLGALFLIVANAVWLNADILTQKDEAQSHFDALMALPDGSAVVTNRYAWKGFTVYYAIAQGKDIIPIFLTTADTQESVLYRNYLDWVVLDGNNAQELAQDALSKGIPVYYYPPVTYIEEWREAFIYDDSQSQILYPVLSVNTGKMVWAK
jgi:hypothetical protein